MKKKRRRDEAAERGSVYHHLVFSASKRERERGRKSVFARVSDSDARRIFENAKSRTRPKTGDIFPLPLLLSSPANSSFLSLSISPKQNQNYPPRCSGVVVPGLASSFVLTAARAPRYPRLSTTAKCRPSTIPFFFSLRGVQPRTRDASEQKKVAEAFGLRGGT